MLELSLAELAFIGLIALIFIGPKEMPGALRGAAKAMRQVRGMVSDVKSSLGDMLDETGVSEMKEQLTEDAKYIQDLDGNMQRIYDVDELHAAREKAEHE